MTLTDSDDVKFLVHYNVNTEDLARAVANADSLIYSMTNINDWVSNDSVFGILKQIGATYAAWQILIGYNKDEYLDKADRMRQ